MNYFQEYEKQRALKSKLQVGSHWRWKGPARRYNEIVLTRITRNLVYYRYFCDNLSSSMSIEKFMREAVYLGAVIELAQ
jgi:hypothetical protein